MLLRAADTAQYAAKRRGGAQFCTAEATPTPELAGGRPPPLAARGSYRAPRRGQRAAARDARRRAGGARHARSPRGRAGDDRGDHQRRRLDDLVRRGRAAPPSARSRSPTIATAGCGASGSACRDEVYELADYPQTAAIVEAGGGSFLVDVDDRDSDPAERELLAELGFQGVLGAPRPRLPTGVFLIELYADADTGDLSRPTCGSSCWPGRPPAAPPAARRASTSSASAPASSSSLDRLGARLAGVIDEDGDRRGGGGGARARVRLPILRRDPEGGRRPRGAARRARGRTPGAQGRRLAPAGRTRPGRPGAARGPAGGRRRRAGRARLPQHQHRRTRSAPSCAPRSWCGDDLWGAINLENGRLDAFDEDDARLVAAVADQAGAALEAARHLAQLEPAYLDTAEALTAALEAKDSYTAPRTRTRAPPRPRRSVAPWGWTATRCGCCASGPPSTTSASSRIPEAILTKPGALDPAGARPGGAAHGDRRADDRLDRLPGAGPPAGAPRARALGRARLPGRARGRGDPARRAHRVRLRRLRRDDHRPAVPQGAERGGGPGRAERDAGTQFDPDVVAALLDVLDA